MLAQYAVRAELATHAIDLLKTCPESSNRCIYACDWTLQNGAGGPAKAQDRKAVIPFLQSHLLLLLCTTLTKEHVETGMIVAWDVCCQVLAADCHCTKLHFNSTKQAVSGPSIGLRVLVLSESTAVPRRSFFT